MKRLTTTFCSCRKYERTKEVISGFKHNEDQLKAQVHEMNAKLQKGDDRYQRLKSHAESKLDE